MTEETPLEKMARKVLDGRLVLGTVRFSDLNPEQKLAYVLAQLVEQKKETLALMETTSILAKECVEWKKTDEGKAWDARKRSKG